MCQDKKGRNVSHNITEQNSQENLDRNRLSKNVPNKQNKHTIIMLCNIIGTSQNFNRYPFPSVCHVNSNISIMTQVKNRLFSITACKDRGGDMAAVVGSDKINIMTQVEMQCNPVSQVRTVRRMVQSTKHTERNDLEPGGNGNTKNIIKTPTKTFLGMRTLSDIINTLSRNQIATLVKSIWTQQRSKANDYTYDTTQNIFTT